LGGFADFDVLEQSSQGANASFDLALLIFCSVVATVFFEVTLFAGSFNTLGNLFTTLNAEGVEFSLEAVIRLLGEPCFFDFFASHRFQPR